MNEQYPRRETIAMFITSLSTTKVRGVRYGELAVVCQDWRWFIIHVRSGLTVAWMWTDYKRAHRLAQLLERGFNWQYTAAEFKAMATQPDRRFKATVRLVKREERAALETFERQINSEFFEMETIA